MTDARIANPVNLVKLENLVKLVIVRNLVKIVSLVKVANQIKLAEVKQIVITLKTICSLLKAFLGRMQNDSDLEFQWTGKSFSKWGKGGIIGNFPLLCL